MGRILAREQMLACCCSQKTKAVNHLGWKTGHKRTKCRKNCWRKKLNHSFRRRFWAKRKRISSVKEFRIKQLLRLRNQCMRRMEMFKRKRYLRKGEEMRRSFIRAHVVVVASLLFSACLCTATSPVC